MRLIGLLVAAGTLASCSTAPEPVTRSAERQQDYERLIAGKIAGPPVACLPSNRADDMIVIDQSTIAWRQSAGKVYVNHMRSPCMGLGFSTALVTRSFGIAQTCSGDIAHVADLTNHMTVGSCVFGEFTPYTLPGRR